MHLFLLLKQMSSMVRWAHDKSRNIRLDRHFFLLVNHRYIPKILGMSFKETKSCEEKCLFKCVLQGKTFQGECSSIYSWCKKIDMRIPQTSLIYRTVSSAIHHILFSPRLTVEQLAIQPDV